MKKTFSIIALAIMGMMAIDASAQAPKSSQANPASQMQAPQNKMRQPREFTEFAFEGILLDIDQQTRIDSLNAAVAAKAPATCQEGQQCDKQCKDAKKCDKDGKKCDKACDKSKKHDKDAKKSDKDAKKIDKKVKDGKKCEKACADSAACKGKEACQMAGKHGGKAPHKMQGRMAGCPYDQEYIAKVKEILTPEQYVVFLENIVSMPSKMGAPMQGGQKMMPQHKDGRMPMQPRR